MPQYSTHLNMKNADSTCGIRKLREIRHA
eukprot:COSAG06_NODE_65356_length_257_cov_0.651899_1_plen_28_part_10